MLVEDMLLYPEWVEDEQSGLSGRRSRARRARRRRRRRLRKARIRRRRAARRARKRGRRGGARPPVTAAVATQRPPATTPEGRITPDTADTIVPPETGILSKLWPTTKPIIKRPAVWIFGSALVVGGLLAVLKKEK